MGFISRKPKLGHERLRARARTLSRSDRYDYLEAVVGQLSMSVLAARTVPDREEEALLETRRLATEVAVLVEEIL